MSMIRRGDKVTCHGMSAKVRSVIFSKKSGLPYEVVIRLDDGEILTVKIGEVEV